MRATANLQVAINAIVALAEQTSLQWAWKWLRGNMPKSNIIQGTGAPKRSYELFVSLVSEDGKTLSKKKVAGLKSLLIKKFGGLTYYPQRNKGFWKIGDVTFRDEIVILRVLCDRSPAATKFWRDLKSQLEKQWNQRSLLILRHDVHML